MPCDILYDQGNIDTYKSVFCDIFSASVCNDVDHIILGGDFNTDLTRIQSPHTQYLNYICERENIIPAQNHSICDIDYTYESMSNNVRSCIDHFLVSESLFNCIESYCVMHDGDNLSDHDVISIQLAISVKHTSIDVAQTCKLLWRNATSNQIDEYQNNLNILLSNIKLSEHVIECNDRFCDIHVDDIQSYHDQIVAACLQASACIPSVNTGNSKNRIPGWT